MSLFHTDNSYPIFNPTNGFGLREPDGAGSVVFYLLVFISIAFPKFKTLEKLYY